MLTGSRMRLWSRVGWKTRITSTSPARPFQHRLPIDPSSLTRWRGRIGEESVEWLLTQTIRAGQKAGAIDDDSVKRVAVDSNHPA